MPFKTIVTVTGPRHDDSDLLHAAGLCERHGLHLSVLVVQMAAPPPVGEFAAMVSDAWFQERQEDERLLEERTAEVRALLAGRELAHDIASEYCEIARTD